MISVEQLQHKLSADFDLIYFGDLANVTLKHGAIFRLFQYLHKIKFEPNQRIVFYSSFQPSQTILDHIQRAATKIDIDNWFITICCPYDISNSLIKANIEHGCSKKNINNIIIELETTKELSNKNIVPYQTLCFAPYAMLDQTRYQQVRPCCKFNGSIGNYATKTKQDFILDKPIVSIREQLQQGQKPIACNACWNTEKSGGQSLRKVLLDTYNLQGEINFVDSPKVRHITSSAGSECNFKCRICSPHTSSKLADEEARFTLDKNHKKQILLKPKQRTAPNFDIYFNTIEMYLSSLESISFVGGEPFVIPYYHKLVDKIINSGHASHIDFIVNTNCSVWTQSKIDKLKKFKSTTVFLSIDDIGKRFEIQRGGQWQQVYNNIEKWSKLTKQFSVKLCCTVNIQNVLYLDSVQDLANKFDLDVSWWYLDWPKEYCIDNMTQTAKDLVYTKYFNHPNAEFRSIAQRMRVSPPTSGGEFLRLTQQYDQRRDINFADYHQEIHAAMSNRQSCDQAFSLDMLQCHDEEFL